MKRCLIALLAFAAKPALGLDTQFMIQQDVLTFVSKNNSTKVGDSASQKWSETDLRTMPNSLTVQVTVSGFSLYVYPTQSEDSVPVGLSYLFMKNLELGVSVGVNSTKVDKPKTEDSANIYGIFGTYTIDLAKLSVEVSPALSFFSGSETETQSATESEAAKEIKTTTNGHDLCLSILAIVPITEKFSWLSGLSYGMTSTKSTSQGVKTTDDQTHFGLNLSGVRFTF